MLAHMQKCPRSKQKYLTDFVLQIMLLCFCDHTSNYKGKYRVLYSLAACQKMHDLTASRPDILIHIGEITGDYYSPRIFQKEVWRVSDDGEIRDTFSKLRYVFEMPEKTF